MSISRALVSTGWLSKQLSLAPRTLKVLDSSCTPLVRGHEDFQSKHIPGSKFYDLLECVKSTPHLPRNLPEPACFQDYVRHLGVNKGDDVVIYDRGGMLFSCRAWWTFRVFGHESVAVLDGGLKKWEADGLETESGKVAQPEVGNFEVNMNPRLIRTFEELVESSGDGSSQIIDSRKPENFAGVGEEPAIASQKGLTGANQPVPSSMKAGHLKGAINLMEDPVFDPEKLEQYKVFMDKGRLLKVFQDAGVDLKKPMTTMCYLGNAASVLALAAHLCDKPDVAVYHGGWTEFGQRAEDHQVVGTIKPAVAGG